MVCSSFNRVSHILGSLIATLAISACSVMPEPFSVDEIHTITAEDRALINAAQKPLANLLSLEEAMARAVKYNLENRMEIMRTALAHRNFDMVKMDMLPLLTAQAGITDRANWDASRSYNVSTGSETDEYTTSSEKDNITADGRLVWNVLDFGVSYLQAKQEGYRYITGDLERRQTIAKLLDQVRSKFWRAAAMQKIQTELSSLQVEVERTLENLKQVRRESLRPPRQVLEDIRALAEIGQQLEEMRQTADLAIIELGALINEPFDTPLTLFVSADLPDIPDIPGDFENMELIALTNSTEYITEMYNAKIDQLESRKALLRLLPGLEFSYSMNYNTNRYLYNKSWTEAGAKVSYDIFRLLAAEEVTAHNDAREGMALNRRLMTNVAIVTKIHLAWQDFQNARQRYGLSEFIGQIDAEISDLTDRAKTNKKVSGVEKIKTDARAMRSLMGRMQAYVDAQSYYGSFLLSLGLNPVPDTYQDMTLEELTAFLKGFYERVDSGDIDVLSHQPHSEDLAPTLPLTDAPSQPSPPGFGNNEPPTTATAPIEPVTPAGEGASLDDPKFPALVKQVAGFFLDLFKG